MSRRATDPIAAAAAAAATPASVVIAPPTASIVPKPGPFSGKNRFKTIAVMLVVAVAIAFLVRTIMAARKKKAGQQSEKTDQTQQWQSFFQNSADDDFGPSISANHPARQRANAQTPAVAHPVRPHAPHAPHAHVAAPQRRPTHPTPQGDSSIAGGRPQHAMMPQSTRPLRDIDSAHTPPGDISPATKTQPTSAAPAPAPAPAAVVLPLPSASAADPPADGFTSF